jgi:hypothetical protein
MSQLSACVQISRIFARKSALIESLHYARTQIRCTTVRLPLGRRRVCSLVVTRLEEPSSEAIHAPNSTAARSARLACSALEVARRSLHCASSPLVGEDRGGGSRRPTRQASSGPFDNLPGPRDPPPLPAPTRGGGCANAIDSVEMQKALTAVSARTKIGAGQIGVGRIERHQLQHHAIGPAKAVLGGIFAAPARLVGCNYVILFHQFAG